MKCLSQLLGFAWDQLHAAKAAANRRGENTKHCATTGKTIGQLRDEYQAQVDELETALREVKAL